MHEVEPPCMGLRASGYLRHAYHVVAHFQERLSNAVWEAARGPAMSRGTVVLLCARSTQIADPWMESGYNCLWIDHHHPDGRLEREGRLARIGHPLDSPHSWYALRQIKNQVI